MSHLVGLDESSNPSNYNIVIRPLVLGSKVIMCHFLKKCDLEHTGLAPF